MSPAFMAWALLHARALSGCPCPSAGRLFWRMLSIAALAVPSCLPPPFPCLRLLPIYHTPTSSLLPACLPSLPPLFWLLPGNGGPVTPLVCCICSRGAFRVWRLLFARAVNVTASVIHLCLAMLRILPRCCHLACLSKLACARGGALRVLHCRRGLVFCAPRSAAAIFAV